MSDSNSKSNGSRKELIKYINSLEPTFLGTSGYINGQKSYICPCCQSGSGKNRTGISKIPHSTNYHCFSCGESSDIIGLARIYYNTTFYETLKNLCSYYDLPISHFTPRQLPKEEEEDTEEEVEYEDQMEFFKTARKNLDPTYLESRGISKETQEHFWIGTDPNWIHPSASDRVKENPYFRSPRCIIPTSRFSYLARDTRSDLNEFNKKYAKSKYGNTTLFNTKIQGSHADIVYIVEGEIDSMSIYEGTKGYIQAIGLGSTSMWKHLYAEITFNEQLKDKTFVLMLDNDKGGAVCKAKIINLFNTFNIPYVVQDYPLEYSDPNEYLQKNRPEFIQMIKETFTKCKQMEKKDFLKVDNSKDLEDSIELDI